MDESTTVPSAVWPTLRLPKLLALFSGGTTIATLIFQAYGITAAAQLQMWQRVAMIAGALVAPLVIWMLWLVLNACYVALLRIRFYHQLHSYSQAMFAQMQNTTTLNGILCKALALTTQDWFAVINVTRVQNSVEIVLGNPDLQPIEAGNRLMVVDPTNIDFLGDFEVTKVERGSFHARPIGNPHPLWWGYMRQQAERHVRPDANAAAILIHEGGTNVG